MPDDYPDAPWVDDVDEDEDYCCDPGAYCDYCGGCLYCGECICRDYIEEG